MLSEINDKVRVPLFYGITVLAVILIGGYLRTTPYHHRFTRLGLIFILSGALGNFLDRIHRGYVVDFVDTEWRIFGWQHHFAIFNIADVLHQCWSCLFNLGYDYPPQREKWRPPGAPPKT